MTVHELDDFTPAYPVLRELRPDIGSLEDFLTQAKQQQAQGYRMIAAISDGEVAAVAGFRAGLCFAWGHHIYVDDLVTASSARRQGHGAALLAWIDEEARRIGAAQVHLDSGTHRHEAHRRYLTSGFAISSFHFTKAA
ncbi:Acetyltransferase (GNAT) family protein [Saccharopolyspora antimicrobica]|uniref:Acetyltransferase (GNAT) family protein n=1 Tax=Saccharopolyspora antimicrobica TaxID=455193 RepID=A0A1I4T8P0_9PSEU|nr:GNAT family N-acetyltransferase [Saccharopolyspora antimicrobica]RKT85814.1 acetyltransferase (GNAT) family protein [Saccharopolyspora antimicrobica]SFM73092.1 Acetyltransferase (GNAT) family protein [Saccharopolyspora antimicrobica]